MAVGSERPSPKEKCQAGRTAKERTFGRGFGIHAQSGHGAAAPVNQAREESCRKGPAAGVPLQKAETEHQADLQGAGAALLHRARLAVAHARARAQGQYDRKRGRRKCRMSKSAFKLVRRRLKRKSGEFGFEPGSWQLNLVREMIRRELGIDCKARTLRRWLRRIGFSWRKNRHVPRRSATRKRQGEFKSEVGERVGRRCAAGRIVFAEDEASVQMEQNPAYGWRL